MLEGVLVPVGVSDGRWRDEGVTGLLLGVGFRVDSELDGVAEVFLVVHAPATGVVPSIAWRMVADISRGFVVFVS